MNQGHDRPLSASFAYPSAPRVRRHGPLGYSADENYKPWLRDEFGFACVYCLFREVWQPDEEDAFSVEHLDPRSLATGGLTGYDRLAYACCQCNASRQAKPLPLDPCGDLSSHLAVREDGGIRALTAEGMSLIRLCRLDRPNLARHRRLLLDLLALLGGDDAATDLGTRFLAYPADLPDLSLLRPPGGNSRPEGVALSAFARRQRGELPATC